MEKRTIRETYGIQLLLDLQFETDLIDEIAGMAEDEIPTWRELDAMGLHVDELIAASNRYLPGETMAQRRARSDELMIEVRAVMAAAARYRRLRYALVEIRAGERFLNSWAA